MIFNVFILLGLFHLFLMLRSDMKKMAIDSRHNRFMTGVAVFMYLTNYPGIYLMLSVLFIVIMIFLINRNHMGQGDSEMLTWNLLGFGTMNIVWMLLYVFWYVLLKVIYIIPMKMTKVRKLPGTPIFLGAFILTAVFGYVMDMLVFGTI